MFPRVLDLQPGVEPEGPDEDGLGLVRRVSALEGITGRSRRAIALTSVGQSSSLNKQVSLLNYVDGRYCM